MKEMYPAHAQTDVDTALQIIHSLERDLDAFKHAALNGNLVPLPEETVRSLDETNGLEMISHGMITF